MGWVWNRLRQQDVTAAVGEIDRGLDQLQRELTVPEPIYQPPSVVNVYTPDMSRARVRTFQIIRTTAAAFTIAKPTGFQPGAILVIDLINSSGGALGAATWAPEYFFLTAYVAPGNGQRSTFTFYCGSTALVEIAHEPGAAGGGAGEANTGSNVGAVGVGVFDGKVGVDLQFRKIRNASSKLTVVLNAQQVDLDVAQENLTLDSIGGDLSFSKIQQIATDRLLGRDTAGTGDIEQIQLTDSLQFDGAGGIELVGDAVTPGVSKLYGTDAGGNRGWHNQPAGWIPVKKPSDTVKASDATLAADPHLVIELSAGTTYLIRGHVWIEVANAAADYKFDHNYTGTITEILTDCSWGLAGGVASTNGETTVALKTLMPSTTVLAATAGLAAVEFEVRIETNTAGTFQFRWAQGASHASNVTCHAGSYLEYQVL